VTEYRASDAGDALELVTTNFVPAELAQQGRTGAPDTPAGAR
jgi:hypothetical protein